MAKNKQKTETPSSFSSSHWVPDVNPHEIEEYLRVAQNIRDKADESFEDMLEYVSDPDVAKIDNRTLLAALSGGGTASDIMRLRKLLRSSVSGMFSLQDWETLFIDRLNVRKGLCERLAWQLHETGNPLIDASEDPVCAWMKQAAPAGFSSQNPVPKDLSLLSTPRYVVSGDTAPSFIQNVSFSRFEQHTLKSAATAPRLLTDSFGLEGDIIQYISTGKPLPMKMIKSFRGSEVRAYEAAPPNGRRPLPAILSALGELEIQSREMFQETFDQLIEENIIKRDDWEEFLFRRLKTSNVLAFGPDYYCEKILQGPLYGQYSNQTELDDAFGASLYYVDSDSDEKKLNSELMIRWHKMGAAIPDATREPKILRKTRNILWNDFIRQIGSEGGMLATEQQTRLREILFNRTGLTSAEDIPFFIGALLSANGRSIDDEALDASLNFFMSIQKRSSANSVSNNISDMIERLGRRRNKSYEGLSHISRAIGRYMELNGVVVKPDKALILIDILKNQNQTVETERLSTHLRNTLLGYQGQFLSADDVKKSKPETISYIGKQMISQLSDDILPIVAVNAAKSGNVLFLKRIINYAIQEGKAEKIAEYGDIENKGLLFYIASMKNISEADCYMLFNSIMTYGAKPERPAVNKGVMLSPLVILAKRGFNDVLQMIDTISPGLLNKKTPGEASAAEIASFSGHPLPGTEHHVGRFTFTSTEAGRKSMTDWIDKSEFVEEWDGDLHENPLAFASTLRNIADRTALLFKPKSDQLLSNVYREIQRGSMTSSFAALTQLADAAIEFCDWPIKKIAIDMKVELEGRLDAARNLQQPEHIFDALDQLSDNLDKGPKAIRKAFENLDLETAISEARKTIAARKALSLPIEDHHRLMKAIERLHKKDKLIIAKGDSLPDDTLEDIIAGQHSDTILVQKTLSILEDNPSEHRFIHDLKKLAYSGDWLAFSKALQPLHLRAKSSEMDLFSRVAQRHADFLAKRQGMREQLKEDRIAEVVDSCKTLSTFVYNNKGYIPGAVGASDDNALSPDFKPIPPETLELESSGVDPTGRKFTFENGLWKSDVCKAAVVSRVIDGQEIIFLAVRGTHWVCDDEKETTGTFKRVLSILRDYMQIWRHADRLKELADACDTYAMRRGAKFVMTGHSLGGSTVETLMDRTSAAAAFVFASAGTGTPDNNGNYSKSWFKKRPGNPKVIQFRDGAMLDLIPVIGRLGGFTSSATVIDTSHSMIDDPNITVVGRSLRKLSALANNVKGFFVNPDKIDDTSSTIQVEDNRHIIMKGFSKVVASAVAVAGMSPFKPHSMQDGYSPKLDSLMKDRLQRRRAEEVSANIEALLNSDRRNP